MQFYIIISIYLFVSFFITSYTKHTDFVCKIIYTQIYPIIPILRFHSILILEKDNISKYAIDFSPEDDITRFNVMRRLLIGKTLKGKIRIIDLSKNELEQRVF